MSVNLASIIGASICSLVLFYSVILNYNNSCNLRVLQPSAVTWIQRASCIFCFSALNSELQIVKLLPCFRMCVALYQLIRRWQPRMPDFDHDLNIDVQTKNLCGPVFSYSFFSLWKAFLSFISLRHSGFYSLLPSWPRCFSISVWIKSLFDASTCAGNTLSDLASIHLFFRSNVAFELLWTWVFIKISD